MTGLPESMDIISYLKAPIAPAAADREELAAWKKRLFPNIPRLVRPRLHKMPVADWADPRDVEYGIWKSAKKVFDAEKPQYVMFFCERPASSADFFFQSKPLHACCACQPVP